MKTTLIKFFDNLIYRLNIFKNVSLIKESSFFKPRYHYSFEGVDFSNSYIPEEDVLTYKGGTFLSDHEKAKVEIMKNYIDNYNSEAQKINLPLIKKRSLWVWIASTSLILVFMVSIAHSKFESQFIDSLYKTYFTTPEISTTFFTNPVMLSDKNWMMAIQSFEEKNYFVAREYLLKIQDSNTLSYASFLNAVCLMQENKYPEAIELLVKLQPEKSLNQITNWYTALCYLKTGNLNSAKTMFLLINATNNPFSKKAGEILYKIDKVH